METGGENYVKLKSYEKEKHTAELLKFLKLKEWTGNILGQTLAGGLEWWTGGRARPLHKLLERHTLGWSAPIRAVANFEETEETLFR